jgi:hypothetical protein
VRARTTSRFGDTSRASDESVTGTEGFATVSTVGVTPWAGKYFANLRTRPTPAPPVGGNAYDTSKALIGVALLMEFDIYPGGA